MDAANIVEESLSKQTVIYIPYGGTQRSISALIEYLGPQRMDGMRAGSRPRFGILVRNNSVYGISSKEINTGKDKIQIAFRYGRSTRVARIVEITAQDKAMLRLLAY